jgi:hypothetical protein
MKDLSFKENALFFKKLKTIFFEYYKQGFLFGHYILNRGLYFTKEELRSSILEDFKLFFENNREKHFSTLQNSVKPFNLKSLNLSDIIVDKSDKDPVEYPKSGKILTKCPLCKKTIYAKDIDFTNIELSKINNFPFDYIFIHSNREYPPHALLMYFDAQYNIRGRKVVKFINIKKSE